MQGRTSFSSRSQNDSRLIVSGEILVGDLGWGLMMMMTEGGNKTTKTVREEAWGMASADDGSTFGSPSPGATTTTATITTAGWPIGARLKGRPIPLPFFWPSFPLKLFHFTLRPTIKILRSADRKCSGRNCGGNNNE